MDPAGVWGTGKTEVAPRINTKNIEFNLYIWYSIAK
jgi:hypothetical protein